ncbi:phosphoribosylglycinamide formyltransferase [Myxococcota bacterium]|nr:phosphoribosylglycinamide formyltransferase [Myxococcota bacterium]
MNSSEKAPLAILISGRGSNMVSLVEAARQGRLGADVRLVVSNRPDAPGLEAARSLGVETAVLCHRDFPDRESFDRALADLLESRGVRFVALAGFMRVLTPAFLDRFPGRVVNIHPALLPSFPGVHAQRQALEYGVRVTGCTVHFVDAGTDTGAIIAQAAVPVEDGDDEETLSARILAAEHQVYPSALEDVLKGRLRIQGRRVLRTGD